MYGEGRGETPSIKEKEDDLSEKTQEKNAGATCGEGDRLSLL